jgi:CheY-like chemotaxis protein
VSLRRRVLVVDDDVAVRLRVGDLLQSSDGFELREASDGRTGLTEAIAFRPDLILLDIMLPGFTGLEVCAALRAEESTREIPVIVLSAAEESEAMVNALEAGADDFLLKPFYAAELRAKVRTITRLNRYRTLAAERDRFRWLIDRSTEPLVVAGADGSLLFSNVQARTLFDLGTAPGGDIVAAISRHFQAEPAGAWTAWRERRLPPAAIVTLLQPETPQVAARWFEVEFHALDDGTNQTLLKFTDVTSRMRLELETYTFQHLIAHKLRTPLNGLAPILRFLEASEDIGLDDTATDMLQIARESAERLEDTLTGILAFHAAAFPTGACQQGSAKPFRAVLAAAAAAAELAEAMAVDAPDGEVNHAETLEVVLTEVLENYVKFAEPRQRRIELSLRPQSDRWSLQLFAVGKRLRPEALARLGQPYAQLESSPTGEIPGIGLGLATARLLLRAIGGDLALANHPERAGLLTTIRLPFGGFQPTTAHANERATH